MRTITNKLLLMGAMLLTLLVLATGAQAESVNNVDFTLAFNENQEGSGDGLVNDALFHAHDEQHRALADVTILVLNGTGAEVANLTTDADGEAAVFNLTADTYAYEAYLRGNLFEGGNFVVDDEYWLASGHFVGPMDGSAIADDFAAGNVPNDGTNYTEAWVEVYDDNGTLLYDGYTYMSTEGEDGENAHFFPQMDMAPGEYWFEMWEADNYTNFLQNGSFFIAFSAWYADWEWYDYDSDDDGYNDTKEVLFDVDTNIEDTTTLYVEIYVYDDDGEEVDYDYMEIEVTGDEEYEFNWSFAAEYTSYYDLYFILYDENETYYDYFFIEDNYLEIGAVIPEEWTAWFEEWDYYDYDDDDDSYNETKHVWYDVDTDSNETQLLRVDIEIQDSDWNLVDWFEIWINVTGNQTDTFWFNWSAEYNDEYDFFFYLYDENDDYLDDFSISDNWLQVEENWTAWFEEWDYEDIDDDWDDYNETKTVWFGANTSTNETRTLKVKVNIYDEEYNWMGNEEFFIDVAVNSTDVFWFNWSAEYSSYYTFYFDLYSEYGEYFDSFSIEDNWLEVDETDYLCIYCLNIANGVIDEDDGGAANDIVFWAHIYGNDDGKGDIGIKVYYADNDTLYASGTTDEDGYLRFYNATANEYYWMATDPDGNPIDREGGVLVVGSEYDLQYYGVVMAMDRDNLPNDFIAAMNYTTDDNASKWVEIYSAKSMELLFEGWSVEGDFGDGEEMYAFIQSNLSVGLYYYEIWEDDQYSEFWQNGTFVICWPNGCLNIDATVGDFTSDEDFDDVVFYAREGEREGYEGITITIHASNGSLVAEAALDHGFLLLEDLPDDLYDWNATLDDGGEEVDSGRFLIQGDEGYNHSGMLVDITESKWSWNDDFVFYLRVDGASVDDAFVVVHHDNGTMVADGYTLLMHEGTYYFLAGNLTPGRYFFDAYRNDSQAELVHNGTFVVCPPLLMQAELWFEWKHSYTDEYEDGEDWTGWLNIEGEVATNIDYASGWVQFDVYDDEWRYLYGDSWDFDTSEDDYWYFDWDWSTDEQGRYYVDVYIFDEEGHERHYQYHEFCLGDDCYSPPAWFEDKQDWVEDTDDDDITDTWYLDGKIATDQDGTVSGWLQVIIYDGNGTQVHDYAESFNVTKEENHYFYYDWYSDQTDWYSVEVSLWDDEKNNSWHTQWHHFSFEERMPFWFAWKHDWIEDTDDDGIYDTWHIDGEVVSDSDTWRNGRVELVIFDGNETQVYDYYANFSVNENESFEFSWSWSSNDTGWYYAEMSLWSEAKNETIHYQEHYFEFRERAKVYFDWKTTYIDEYKDGDNWTGMLGIEGEIATWVDNETQYGYIEFQVFNENYSWLYTDSLDYMVEKNTTQYFDWNWSIDEPGYYYIEVRIYNDTNEEIHYQSHDYCLGDGCHEGLAWFSWKDDWTEDEDDDGTEETIYINGEITTDSDETVNGWLEFVVYGPYGEEYREKYSFEVNCDGSHYFSWNWTADEPGRYSVEVRLWDGEMQENWHTQWHDFELEACFDCFNIANGVLTMHDDDTADDVVFKAHLGGEKDVPGIGIEVYYSGNDTLAFTGTTDEDGEIWFANVSSGDYYWLAYDPEGQLIGHEGGEFIVGSMYEYEAFGFAGRMDESWFPNDFMAGASDFSGENHTFFVEIHHTGSDELVTSGEMVENEDYGRNESDGPNTMYIWHAEDLPVGLYNYTIWYDDAKEVEIQFGHFEVCDPYGCLNIDVWVQDFDGDYEMNDAVMFIEEDAYWMLENVTIHLFDSTDKEVANLTLGHTPPIFQNLTSDLYHWTATAPDGTLLMDHGYFVVDVDSGFDHFAALVDTEDHEGEMRINDDFVFSLNNTQGPIMEAYVEVYYANGTVVASGYPSEEHDLRQWFGVRNLTAGRYTFSAWANDSRAELVQNGTFVVCVPVKPKMAPFAEIATITPQPADEGEMVYFYGDYSDEDGTVVEWRWLIDGWFASDNDTFSLDNLSLGDHVIRFAVMDNDGLWSVWDEAGLRIIAPGNKAPVAYIDDLVPNPAVIGSTIYFNGSGTDEDGTVVAYNWTINGWHASDAANFSLANLTIDTYTVVLSVQDDQGVWSATTTATLEVTPPPNEVPTAEIDSIAPQVVTEGENVAFNGTGDDEDGTVEAYEWASDLDDIISTARNFSTATLNVGNHTITFRVQDDDGDWSEGVQSWVLVKPEEVDNDPPRLSLLIEPDFDNGIGTIYVTANEPLVAPPTVMVTYPDGRGGTYPVTDMAFTGTDDDGYHYEGTYDSSSSGLYTVTATGTDLAGHQTTVEADSYIEGVEVSEDEPIKIDAKDEANAELEIHTTGNASGKVAVQVTTDVPPSQFEKLDRNDTERVKRLDIYVSIDISQELLDELDYINLTIYYKPYELPADVPEDSLVLMHQKLDGTWEKLDSHVNTVENLVWAHITNFSIFGIFGANVAPSADGGEDQAVQVGTEIALSGTAEDIDGEIVLYEWDFDGDGTYDWSSADSGEASHYYNDTGKFTATLRVTDNQGSTSYDTVTVEVTKDKPDEDDGGIPGFELVLVLVGLLFVARRRRR